MLNILVMMAACDAKFRKIFARSGEAWPSNIEMRAGDSGIARDADAGEVLGGFTGRRSHRAAQSPARSA
jgi:hypothetical protein